MGKLFGTDGIRALAPDILDAPLSQRVGQATGRYLLEHSSARPRVLIGADTRISSDMLVSAVCSGLCEAGVDCYNAGVIPTPAVSYLVKQHSFDAGIMISASHNPYFYNGIKLLSSEGVKLKEDAEAQIEELILSNKALPRAPREAIGRIFRADSLANDYTEHLISSTEVSLSGLRICIDAANGAASAFAARIFPALGAECHIINSSPDGVNINTKCGSTDMRALREVVLSRKPDCAFAFDGDADRCLALDGDGREVDGDAIMAILALDMKRSGRLRGASIVGTVMSNYGLEKFAKENGLSLLRTPVGDKYVYEELEANGYSLGGEQSGHIIIKDRARTGDGMLTAIALLSALVRSGASLSSLSSVYKKYPQHTVNIEAGEEEKQIFKTSERAAELIKNTEAALEGRGRIVVRPSGTEPVIRIMAEGEDESVTRGICEKLATEISGLIKKSGN